MKRKQVSALLVAPILGYTNGGCASLTRGSYQSIGLTSDPGGAYVKVDGVDKGSTPMVIKMRRKWSHTVQLDKEGYKTYEASLISKSGGWILGNLLIGALIGLIVDLMTGASDNLVPGEIRAELQAP